MGAATVSFTLNIIAPPLAMRLAVFDLDNTLLNGDSDFLWGQFLCDEGLVVRSVYEATNRRFHDDYSAGTLDVQAFYRFSLAPLTQRPVAEWLPLRERFIATRIQPIIGSKTYTLLANHRNAGDTLIITTATQRFITQPIAELLGVPNLIAADPEVVAGRFTGHMQLGNFQGQKVARLNAWIATLPKPPLHITAYSDSRNDIPLLQSANQAVAVDPDPVLRLHAETHHWQVMSLR